MFMFFYYTTNSSIHRNMDIYQNANLVIWRRERWEKVGSSLAIFFTKIKQHRTFLYAGLKKKAIFILEGKVYNCNVSQKTLKHCHMDKTI